MTLVINFIYQRGISKESKFANQLIAKGLAKISFIDLNHQPWPHNGINIYLINPILPRWLLEEECIKADRTHFSREVSVETLKRIRAKEALLAIDNSGEGPANYAYLKLLESYGRLHDLPPGSILWIHQNIAISEGEKYGWDKSYYVKNLYHHSFLEELLVSATKKVKPTTNLSDSKRSHYYLFLNNIPRPERLYVLLRLYNSGLINKGLVSFQIADDSNVINLDYSINYLKKRHQGEAHLFQGYGRLVKELPLTINEPNILKSEKTQSLSLDAYSKCYFSIVSESEMSSGHVIRYTEKLFKPIYNKHPFVVFGNPYSLSNLRKLGFQTFDGLIDESYDLIMDSKQRRAAAYEQVEKLLKLSIEELGSWYESLRPTIDYNYNHLIKSLPNKIRIQQNTKLLIEVMCLASPFENCSQNASIIADLSIKYRVDKFFDQKNLGHALDLLISEISDHADLSILLEIVVQDWPENYMYLHRYSSVLLKMGLKDKAETMARIALIHNPKAYWTYHLLGDIQLSLQNPLEAMWNFFNAYHHSKELKYLLLLRETMLKSQETKKRIIASLSTIIQTLKNHDEGGEMLLNAIYHEFKSNKKVASAEYYQLSLSTKDDNTKNALLNLSKRCLESI